jgi:hypothetical protein
MDVSTNCKPDLPDTCHGQLTIINFRSSRMRFSRSFRFAAGLAVMAISFAVPVARAQEATRPIAMVSISPLDRLLQDTSFVLKACNVPEIGGLVSIMANQYTQGLDRSKPLGVTITLDGQQPSAVIFMPMSDRGQFFGALAGMGIEPDDLGDGLFEIDVSGQTIFAKQTGDWMFVAQSEAALSNLPADPSAMLGELPNRYNLAFRINVQALPTDVKDMVTQQMRIGFERGLAEQRGQTEEEREAARKLGEAQIAQLEQLITDTDQLILGWNADSTGQKVFIDVGAQFLEGSKLAEQTEAMQNLTSDYTNFGFPEGAARFRFSSEITEDDKEVQKQNLRNSVGQVEKQLDQTNDLPAEAKDLLKDVVQGLVKILEETIDEGKFDGAGSVSLADDTLRVLIGGRLADGRALEQQVKDAVAKLSGNPDAPKVEFDYEVYKGVSLHRVALPVKIADPGAKKVFGDSIKLTIGTADKGFMISLDPSGDVALKAAIDRMGSTSSQKASPFDGVIEVEQLLRFAQSVSPNSMIDNALQTVQQYAGKDKLEITGRIIPRGGIYRIAVDEGVLRAAGAAAKSGGGNGGF